jgi:hypothetical protein
MQGGDRQLYADNDHLQERAGVSRAALYGQPSSPFIQHQMVQQQHHIYSNQHNNNRIRALLLRLGCLAARAHHCHCPYTCTT